jgi:hypothetical protein
MNRYYVKIVNIVLGVGGSFILGVQELNGVVSRPSNPKR